MVLHVAEAEKPKPKFAFIARVLQIYNDILVNVMFRESFRNVRHQRILKSEIKCYHIVPETKIEVPITSDKEMYSV